jgi:hypothetical protein
MTTEKKRFSMPVISASYLGPSLSPNEDLPWDEASMPLNCDDLVVRVLGQPMRRAGRFIKMVCAGATACLKKVPHEMLQGKKTGIFLATGLGNGDEILPFISQVFKHNGGFPSPNQFANSVSNAAVFFLARLCDIKGVILTLSDEELSFESALWLAQTYLESGEIDLALVGGCDVYTPTVEEYRERMNVTNANSRALPIGEGSSWLLLGSQDIESIGEIWAVDVNSKRVNPDEYLQSENFSRRLDDLLCSSSNRKIIADAQKRFLLPGFRVKNVDSMMGRHNSLSLHDYLPSCGIHPVAAAFGLAHALQKQPSSLLVHYNCSASGKPALIVAATK